MGTFNNDREQAKEKYYDFTHKQLLEWGCMFHDLFLGKPSADYYIDDKGVSAHEFFDT
jgi:hypothetical protein